MNDINTVVEFLKVNQGKSTFYASLLTQWEQRGSLSPRQIECVERALTPQAAPVRAFGIAPGQEIEVKQWIAHRLRDDLALPYFFRNVKVIEVLGETAKAYRVRVQFVSGIRTVCHFCGRDLDNEVSRACGVGPVCAVNHGMPRPTVETARETLAELEAMAIKVGVVGPVWVPKSQVVRITTPTQTV